MARRSPQHRRKSGLTRVLAGLLFITLGSLSLVTVAATGASAHDDDTEGAHGDAEATLIDHATNKNPRCGQFDGDETWIEVTKFENNNGGTQDGVTVTFTTPDKVFDWESDLDITAVVVKSGSGGHHLYRYEPHAHEGTGLTTPDSVQAVSHISFCAATPDTLFDLVVNKAMAGNDQPESWSIDFDVVCEVEGEDNIEETVTVTDADAAGDKGVFDIPDGATCTVTESADDADDFDSTAVAVDGGDAENGTSTDVTMDDDHTVTFTNTRNGDGPSYECSAATNVTQTSATLNGTTTDEQAGTATFTLMLDTDVIGTFEDEDAPYSAGVTDLSSDTTYTYTVSWFEGEVESEECEFTTLSEIVIPVITTDDPPPPPPPPPPPTTAPPTTSTPTTDAPEILPAEQVNNTTPPSVLGVVFAAPKADVAPAVLARTGASTTTLLMGGLLLILLGAALLLPSRRKVNA